MAECAEIKKQLSGYADARLDGRERSKVESHLAGCESCRKALAELEAVLRILRVTEPVPAPPDFLHRLHKKINAKSDSKIRFKSILSGIYFKVPISFAAATATAVLLVVLLQVRQPDSPALKSKQLPFLDRRIEISESMGKDVERQAGESERTIPEERGSSRPLPQPVAKSFDTLAEAKKESPFRTATAWDGNTGEFPEAMSASSPPEGGIHSEPVEWLLETRTETRPESEPRYEAAAPEKEKALGFKTESADENGTGEYHKGNRIRRIKEAVHGVGGRIISDEETEPVDSEQRMLIEIPANQYRNFAEVLNRTFTLQMPEPVHQDACVDPCIIRIRLKTESTD